MGFLSGLFGGGGSKAPPTPRTPVEAPNTLRSKTTARILDAVACGPCVGLADGAKSIFYDGVPLQSADGTLNVVGVKWEQRTGLPDQTFIDGFPMVETEMADGLPSRIKAGGLNAITRSILDGACNAVRVTVGLESSFEQDITTGDTNGSRVDFVIRVRTRGQQWVAYPQQFNGKTMGPFQIGFRLPLPGPGPWDIQVERFTPDSTSSAVQNTLLWSSYTAIIDAKLTYPNTGMIGNVFDAELTGNSIPSREYDWIGWIVRVPINYDPVGRTYAGIWDGRMKFAWSDNPAWLFYQLLTSPDAAGLDDSYIDKFALYPIAQYCDQYVPNGYTNPGSGTPIYEPRFTANFIINTKTEAYAVINALSSTFRGMTYWGSGAVQVIADMPRDPDVIVSGANTIDGFTYSGSGQKARHSVALVSYIDKNDNYSRKIEPVENRELIQKIGWEPTDVVAFACSTRGQAHRLGKWILFTEANEGETITYRCSLDHMNVAPGSIIMVQDADYAGEALGGRIVSAAGTAVTLDRPVRIETGKTYNLNVTLPDGTVQKRRITNQPGTHTWITYTVALPALPQVESMWAIEVNDLKPRLFRVVSVQESSKLEFTVTALLHDPTKYPQVELGLRFEPEVFSRLPNPGIVSPPGAITVSREYVSTPNGWTTSLQVSWEPSGDAYTRGYLLRYEKNRGNWVTMPEVTGTSQIIYGESAGHYVFHVQTINFAGVPSRPSIYEVDILDSSPITLISPTGLELEGQGNNTIFNGRNPKFVWRATAIRGSYPPGQEPAAGAGYLDAIFKDYQVRVYAPNGQLVFTDETGETTYEFSFEKNAKTKGGPHRHFTFEVVMRDRWGNVSKPARLEVMNPAPAQPLGLEVVAGFAIYFVKYTKPTDLDFEGTLIWADSKSGFTPDDSKVVYDGPETFKSVQAAAGSTVYIRVAAYDSFGRTGLNVSAEIVVRVAGVVPVDFIPPSVPTGFKLDSRATPQPDGGMLYELLAEWEPNNEDDLLQYELALREVGGNDVYFTSASPSFSIPAVAGIPYSGRIRAWDRNGNFSGYSEPPALHTVGGDVIPPETPTALTLKADFRGVWLEWPKNPSPDFNLVEIWESETNDRNLAKLIARAGGTEFARRDLGGGVERWYWIRAADRSGNVSGWFPANVTAGQYIKTRKIEEADYAELSIGKGILGEAIITDANIFELTAGVLKAGTALAGSITVDGRQLGSTLALAGDPVNAINQGSTLINPGKIIIAGGVSLADWRRGGDWAKIDGGVISTNTIKANSLQIGNRSLDIIGCAFQLNKEGTILSWSGGTVIYEPDISPGHAAEGITPGAFAWPGGGIWYIVWAKGWGNLRWTDDPNVYGDSNQIVVCIWYGHVGFHATFGRTIVHGDAITTGTINANKIQAFSITAEQLSSTKLITSSAQIGDGIIKRAMIGELQVDDGHINTLTASKITSGFIHTKWIDIGNRNDGRGFVTIEARDNLGRHIAFYDMAGIQRVLIGSPWSTPARERDGLYVRDMNGKDILSANGLGVLIAGENQLLGGSTMNIHYFPNTVQFGFQSAPRTPIDVPENQKVVNRTLWTARIFGLASNDFEFSSGNDARIKINGNVVFSWRMAEGFPANAMINVPAGVFCSMTLELYMVTDLGGVPAWVPYNRNFINSGPVWPSSYWGKTFWTIIEQKR
jgi:predicted phage tail protein